MHDHHFDHKFHGCRAHKAGDFTLPGSQPHYPPSLELEPRHLDLALRLEPETETAAGTVTHTIRAAQAGKRKITLHAADMTIESVTDTDGRAVSHEYDGKEIEVTWADAFDAGEERKLAVAYRVKNPAAGLYFSAPSADYPDAPRYAATDNETEHARHWLPTVDLPSVRPTLSFHLTAASDLTILANGAHAGEDDNGDGTKTVHWTLEQPCPSYLTCFAIGDFVRHDDGEFEGIPLSYFTSKQFKAADLARSFGRTVAMLDWLTKKLGHPFPYPKYFQFALPGYGGAMENISLVAWDDRFVLDETLFQEWEWLVDQINIHEMAHSYFGDMITCRDFAHAWLKESWATYTENLWLEHARGKDEGDYDFYTNCQAYIREADEAYKRPIVTRTFNHSWQMYDRHLYPGGAARLHMLRKDLGDDIFFEGVRTYVNRFAFKRVETADFRRTLEEVSGRSLVQWFDQWIHGIGYPALKVAYQHDESKGEITVSVEQTQAADKKEKVPAFETPLDIGWVIDGELHVETLQLDAAKNTFVAKVAKKPEQVRIDPHNRSVIKLDFNPGGPLLTKQLTDAPDVVGRICAARELCKTGKDKNVAAVRAAYANEPFWGVRVRMAEAMAEVGSGAAIDALCEFVANEKSGMVLETVMRCAGKYRDARVRAAIEQRLDAGIGLYRATMAAHEALGAQRDDAPIERLTAATNDGDQYGYGPIGALAGLAASRNPDVVEAIASKTVSGPTSNRVRPHAAFSLGNIGRYLERRPREQAAETLVDLLRDPVQRVHSMASAALGVLGEPSTIPALRSYRSQLSDQEAVDVDRVIDRIRGAQAAKPGGKSKQVEELETKVRKLLDRIEKIESKLEVAGDEGKAEGNGDNGTGAGE